MNPNNNYMYYQPQQMQQMYQQPYMYPPNYVFQPQMTQMQPPFYYMNQPQQMYQQFIGQQQPQQQQQRIKNTQPKTKEQPSKSLQINKGLVDMEIQKSAPKILSESQIIDQAQSINKQGFCHYCNKNGKLCYYCFNNYKTTDCRHGFCFDCLMFKFKINPIKLLLKSDWNCPVRNKQCNCSRCVINGHVDSDQFISNDSVESCNKYAHIIENTKRIKKQYSKKKNIIKDMFLLKFNQLEPKKKKQQQTIKKQMLLNRIRKQMQFTAECIQKLRTLQIQQDRQALHQVIRYNFSQLIELINECKST